MNGVVYQVEHSVEVPVSPAFAWDWRTDVKNWDDPPAQFQLDGPIAAGSWWTTRLPGQEPLRWQIRDVRPGRSFTIEMPLDRATLSFDWRFEARSDPRTTLPQRLVLAGDNGLALTGSLSLPRGAAARTVNQEFGGAAFVSLGDVGLPARIGPRRRSTSRGEPAYLHQAFGPPAPCYLRGRSHADS